MFDAAVVARAIDESLPYSCLATRHSANAVAASTVEMLLYRLVGDAAVDNDPARLARQLLDALTATDRELLKDDKVHDQADQRRHHATELTKEFLASTLPIWRRLGVQ